MGIFNNIWQALTGKKTTATTTALVKPQASSPAGYDAGGYGRRALAWNASKLGPNTLLWSNLETLRARSRDAIRNSAIARSAIDKWESNVIGTGIQCHFMHPDPAKRAMLQKAWDKWTKQADFADQLSFYGLQSLVAREVFEAGECFARFHIVAPDQVEANQVPLQIQLMESEQCPIFRVSLQSTGEYAGNDWSLKSGIVFDNKTGKRVGFDMYKGQPYDTMFDPAASTNFIFIPKDECIQVVRPLRAGQLRGEPQLTAVLTLLHEIEGYADAERVRKKVASMFAAFLTEQSTESQVFPPAPITTTGDIADPFNTPNPITTPDIGTTIGHMEPGTIQKLLPGEQITFPQLPETGDYQSFMYVELHRFAAGCGMTYEALTMDLKGVNYSSIRAGLLEFRRAVEQYQKNILIHGFCEPIKNRFIKEAVLCGAVDLPDYFDDPTPYESVVWVPQGFDWVDPQKDITAAQLAVRAGFTSRTQIVRESGLDPDLVDAQQADERQKADKLGLIYDSDPNKVLIGRESQPVTTEEPTPESPDNEPDTE